MKWLLKQGNRKYPQKLQQKYSSSFLQLLSVRQIPEEKVEQYLSPSRNCLDKLFFSGADKAYSFFQNLDFQNANILIFGDYDVDGITSTYILYQGIKELGFQNVVYYIPHREQDGYGLKISTLEELEVQNFDLVITCDNGITATEAVAYLKKNTVSVIITDHHEPIIEEGKEILPDADLIINPKCLGNELLKFREYCGAVVATVTLKEIYLGYGRSFPWEEYLPFLSLATICDVMPLVEENRVIVKEGLRLCSQTNNLGWKALMKELGLDASQLSGYHMGFLIGPCVNATGRLETAQLALELFQEEKEDLAIAKAKQLISLNEIRRKMTEEGTEKAIMQLEKENKVQNPFLIAVVENLHESIAGIVAGRVRERYYKPTLIFSKGKHGYLKGSGRSIEEINLYEILSEYRALFENFGGHKMACGASIQEENLKKLEECICQREFPKELFEPKLRIDLRLNFQDLELEFVEELSQMEPFGKENEKPIFGEKQLELIEVKKYQKNSIVYRMLFKNAAGIMKNVIFFDRGKALEEKCMELLGEQGYQRFLEAKVKDKFDLAFHAEKNEYMGNVQVQLKMIDFRLSK